MTASRPSQVTAERTRTIKSQTTDGELDGEHHLVEPFVHRPVMVCDRVGERIVAEQATVLKDQLAGAQMPPEVGVLNGSRDREGNDHQHRGDEKSAR